LSEFNPYYEHAGVKIYHGDSREIIPLLDPVDLCLTDPMYGNNHDPDGHRRHRHKWVPSRKFQDIATDKKPFYPAHLLLSSSFKKIIIFGANHFSSRLPDASCWLVWDKREGTTPDNQSDCELAWTNLPGPARLYHHLWRGICRRGEENIASLGARIHPYQKPVSLMTWCILQAEPVESIIDPYMGSGTSLLAAKRLGKRAIGIDIERWCCDQAIERLSQEILPLFS
jgi:site-specific DNA-methyltransferase (adenine-specific)/modification methylase